MAVGKGGGCKSVVLVSSVSSVSFASSVSSVSSVSPVSSGRLCHLNALGEEVEGLLTQARNYQ